jgi:hypothetical protein
MISWRRNQSLAFRAGTLVTPVQRPNPDNHLKSINEHGHYRNNAVLLAIACFLFTVLADSIMFQPSRSQLLPEAPK